jgi:alanine racemase
MLSGFGKMLGHTYEPLNRIEISKSALKNNLLYLNTLNKSIKIAPVLKSNAYGHGIKLIAKELDGYHPPFLAVDSLYEAYELLKIGIRTPILVMGYFNPASLQTKRLPFSFAVFNQDQLKALDKYQPQANVHVFVDTGMHREGVPIDTLANLLSFIKTKTNLGIEGLMSHLAMADKPKNIDTKRQIETFSQALDIAKKMSIYPKWAHIANSSGILNSNNYGNRIGNICRTGLALYGIDPEGKNKKLVPVLKFNTQIADVKEINKGNYVGYDFTFKAKRKMKIAILPVGYYDGVDRRLSNLGFVQINGQYCPIIGRVSMNITTVEVSSVQNAVVGQQVLVYSNTEDDKNSVENAAKLSETIPYDLLVHLAPSTRRSLI